MSGVQTPEARKKLHNCGSWFEKPAAVVLTSVGNDSVNKLAKAPLMEVYEQKKTIVASITKVGFKLATQYQYG